MKINRFEDLKCWQEARNLVRMIYQLSENGKLSKDFGTRDQWRRASLSVMNNITEGFARYNIKEFIKFLNYSQSSAAEVKSIVYILDDLNYLGKPDIEDLHNQTDKVRNMTLGFIKYLKNKEEKNLQR